MRTQNQELKLNNFLKILKNKIDMIIYNKPINIKKLSDWEMTLSIMLSVMPCPHPDPPYPQ